MGLHAVAMSRHAGLWCGVKIVADIADASCVVPLDGILDAIPYMPLRDPVIPPVLLPPGNLDAEHDLITRRMARTCEYARAAGLNRITYEPRRPRVALVAAGMGHQALLRALDDLGIDASGCEALGLRVVALGMPWPVDRDHLRTLLAGVETVLVIEDKLPFVETQVKEALYGLSHAPLVVGKEHADGTSLLSSRSALSADHVAGALGRVLGEGALLERAQLRLAQLDRHRRTDSQPAALTKRTPYFCSGCPHNVSTRASSDQLVGVGIGCHIMVALDGGERRGRLLGMTQMGGEGAQWLGLAPFTEDEHFIQNIGDGTFHHSGSLALRAATAAGVRMTYKFLYNDAVAMTGGQAASGRLDVASLTRWLALEGVRRVVITTPEPAHYDGVSIDPIASVRHRDHLQEVQRELTAVDGVTVLIHDDRCATEKRRLRKRGKLDTPPERVWINERVCEGCGDCGEQSTCLSVLPVPTDFGRKTRIHQSSCSQDFTCLKGDCPSFLLVTPNSSAATRKREAPELPIVLQDPAPRVPRDVLVRMPGVGGTGVVTVSAVLQMAAHLDGLFAAGLEQVGLAQKGGPVISDVRISRQPVKGQLRATVGAANLLLGFDLLGAAAADTLAVVDRSETVAVVNTADVPTAEMVTDASVPFSPPSAATQRIAAATRSDEAVFLDAQRLAELLFGDHIATNIVLLGAAFQHGCLPLTVAAIERAIELNGLAVQVNLAAFRWGRASIADPVLVERALARPASATRLDARAADIVAGIDADGELRQLLENLVAELIAYQDTEYARVYAEEVARVAGIARRRAGDAGSAVAEAYARGLYKLMAYKDEYEVARLHLDAAERARRDDAFGAEASVKVLLHPPVLRALGLKRKLRLGPWAFPLLGLLYGMRRLRGTRVDPFGIAHLRRVERDLVPVYRALVNDGLEHLDVDSAGLVTELAALPDLVRGYEQVKLRSIDQFDARAHELLGRLRSGAPTPLMGRAGL